MKSTMPHHLITGKFLTLILVGALAQGCMPKAAEVEETETSKIETTQRAPQAPSAQQSDADRVAKQFGLPDGVGEKSSLTEEQVAGIVEQMTPEHRTTVVLRYLSMVLLSNRAIYDGYPTEEEGLDLLLDPRPDPQGRDRDPLTRDILLYDGWGNRVEYKPVTLSTGIPFFELRSLGPDGVISDDDVFPEDEALFIETAEQIEAGALEQ